MSSNALAILLATASALTVLHARAASPELPGVGVSLPDASTSPSTYGSAFQPDTFSDPAILKVAALVARPDLFEPAFRGRGVRLNLESDRSARPRAGALALSDELALGPAVSLMRRDAGFDSVDRRRTSNFLERRNDLHVLTVGYAWHQISVEGSASTRRTEESARLRQFEETKLAWRSARLSYRPSPPLLLQVSRGTASGLDQLVPYTDVRRTTLSATYTRNFTAGEWQTTVAWGRNARKLHADTLGYLAESAVRFGGRHTAFGRIEQVGSDDLYLDDLALRGQFVRMKKLTIGYYQDVHRRGRARIGVGAIASRHFLPSSHFGAHDRHPISYMLFMRVSLE